jgi:hypothetical protein
MSSPTTTTTRTTGAPFTYPTRPATPAPGAEVVERPHPVTPWLGVIIFSLLFAAAVAAAGWYYKYRTEKNEKFVEELRANLLATMSAEDTPMVRRSPYQLRVDAARMPPPVIPDDGKSHLPGEKKKKKSKSKEKEKERDRKH